MAVPNLEVLDRAPGRIESAAVPSDLIPVPMVDGVPQWDTPNTLVVGTIDVVAPVPVLTFDLAIEGTDDPTGLTGWSPLVKAEGMSAVGTNRDGSDFVPTIKYRSTTITAVMMRIVVESNIPARYGVMVEVI